MAAISLWELEPSGGPRSPHSLLNPTTEVLQIDEATHMPNTLGRQRQVKL
jgi:hypothetical protein